MRPAQLRGVGRWAGAMLLATLALPAIAAGPGDWIVRDWPRPLPADPGEQGIPELQMHGFHAEGSTVLPNGMETMHSVTLRCAGNPLPCLVVGTFTGPLGRDWDFSGDITRDGNRAVLAIDVEAPDGRTVPFTITLSRDDIARLFRPEGGEACSDPQS